MKPSKPMQQNLEVELIKKSGETGNYFIRLRFKNGLIFMTSEKYKNFYHAEVKAKELASIFGGKLPKLVGLNQ